jgi:hypothetical protein
MHGNVLNVLPRDTRTGFEDPNSHKRGFSKVVNHVNVKL